MSYSQPIRVLHVDDDEASRYMVGRTLKQLGFETTPAGTGEEALTLALGMPDAVLLDVKLPGIDGFEVCRRLRSDPRTARLPILHLSHTYFEPKHMVHGLDTGADAYLTHPADPGVLGATIRALVRSYRAEAANREWRDRYEAAVVASGQVLCDWDLSLDTVTWGGSYQRILGYSEEEMQGGLTAWIEKVHPEDREAYRGLIEGLRQRPTRFSTEYRVLRKSGATITVRQDGYPELDSGGHPVRIVGFIVDVTGPKLAEARLRQQALVFENMHDSVIILDPGAVVTDWNPASEAMFGYTKEEMLGRSILGLVAEGAEDLRAKVMGTLEKVGRWQGELAFARKDGVRGVCDTVVVAVRGAGGEIEQAIAVSRDVTRRRKLEDQLRQAQKMEAVGRLAGGVAHDFNNLLTVICGYSDLLLARFAEGDPLHHAISEINRAANRAAGLVRQLLAFSRRQVLQPRGLDLGSAISNVAPMLRRLIGPKIELVTTASPDLAQVRMNPVQIEQVIVNTALNARDAMPEGGRLTLESANVELSDEEARQRLGIPGGSYVRLSISDTGCGMDPETQSRMFEPFFTTKGRAKSTGLGLSTVYGVVKQANGGIEVLSEEGRGTTLNIFLPQAPQDPAGYQELASKPGPVRGTGTILVVEDEEVVRTLVRDLLQAAGYTVLEARNGSEALQLCARHNGPIHMVVTDLVMPDINGRELAERLQALRPTLRVLYMSGYTEVSMVHHGVLEAGALFLQKPFTPEELMLRVREALQSEPNHGRRMPFMERLPALETSEPGAEVEESSDRSAAGLG